jgi:hypothetical protein
MEVIIVARKVQVALAVVTFMVTAAILASSAMASGWTVLGGAPLFPGGIPNANQQGRNKFVHDMLSHKGVAAQKRAGLNKRERQAVKQALVRGEFKKCTLHYGDSFEFMAYGVGTIFVDRNVTFKDPRYKGHGAPAFCLTVEVSKSGGLLSLKVSFRCENFGGNRKKLKPVRHEKPEKPKPKPERPRQTKPPAPEAPAETPKAPEPSKESEKPAGPSIRITNTTGLNMIPAGKTSSDFHIGVYASEAGGVLTVDPEMGGISSCEGSIPEDHFTTSVPAGTSEYCVNIYAPEDADEPEFMLIYETVNLGSAHEELFEIFGIQYPSRP